MGYYKDELNLVNTKNLPIIKVTSSEGQTNWLTLNQECVNELREWLDENYPVKRVDSFIQPENLIQR